VLTDLGLTAVQGATGVTGLWEPNPNRAASLENLKKRCDMFAALGLSRVYASTATTQKITLEDYKAGVDNMREAGDIAKQFNMSLRIEFVRTSSFISTLTTLLKMTRAAAHPNLAPMFDCYHFWSGLNKLEDLDLIRPSEIGHVHFQDVPDMPRELLDNTTRIIPGDGVSPLIHILRKLADKGYAGPLSVELFLPKFQQRDPLCGGSRDPPESRIGHASKCTGPTGPQRRLLSISVRLRELMRQCRNLLRLTASYRPRT
jgi:4-hydroxyphenylpyruvate dioxygenase